MLLSEKNALFESLIGKLYDYPELEKMIYDILFGGKKLYIIRISLERGKIALVRI